jgi:hypothetical protein
VLKVSGGIPAWANESGAVTSVNGATGAVTVAAALHAAEHEAGEADEIQAMAALVDTEDVSLNGIYVPNASGATSGGRLIYYKPGTRENTKLEYNVSLQGWYLIKNTVVQLAGQEEGAAYPWTPQQWLDQRSPQVLSNGGTVTRAPLEILARRAADGTSNVAPATTSADGLLSSSDKTKLDGIASGAEVNVNADWNASSGDAQILNKPTSLTPTAHAASHHMGGDDELDWNLISNTPTLGSASGADIGTGSTEVAAGDHVHGNLTSDGKVGSDSGRVLVTTTAGAVTALALGTAGQVLTVNSGANGVEFAAASGGGVTGAASSASDVLGVSGANITGVDANADRIVFWDDSASKLAYLEAGSGLSLSGTTLSATGGGVTTGSVDNAIIRADGTGGSTSQSSDLVIDDATTSTQNNVALRNNHSQTDSALVLTPKGTGAFIVGPKPDGTSTGGNARGSGAICIQTSRTAATQVASTTDSIAIGNRSTSSSSLGESVAIGPATTASGSYSTCVGGRATATNTYACALGHDADATFTGATALGNRTSATNTDSIAIGTSASCSGAYSVSIGRDQSVTATSAFQFGSFLGANSALYSCGFNTVPSVRAQFATLPFSAVYWGGQTTDGTANVELNLDATATNRMTIAANTAVLADIYVVARQTDNSRFLAARRWVAIRRDGSNNTALIGAVQTIETDQSEGSPTWTFTIDADDTAAVETLRVRVTGTASQTVNWRVMALYRVVA